MCVIINIEDGKFPSYATLQSAESLNDDGGSIAWLEDGKINYHKGITAKKINKIIERRLKVKKVDTAIIHFRIASVGDVNKKLCHPFQISNDVRPELKVEDCENDLLFHNGTIHDWESILIENIKGLDVKIPIGELSDSRIMAWLVNLKQDHEFLDDTDYLGNKFSILTKNGIVKYGHWITVGDNECSNDYFVKKQNSAVFVYGSNYSKTNDPFNDEQTADEIQTELDGYLVTNEDLRIYNKLIREYYVSDQEILEQLNDGKEMEEIEALFDDMYTVSGKDIDSVLENRGDIDEDDPIDLLNEDNFDPKSWDKYIE